MTFVLPEHSGEHGAASLAPGVRFGLLGASVESFVMAGFTKLKAVSAELAAFFSYCGKRARRVGPCELSVDDSRRALVREREVRYYAGAHVLWSFRRLAVARENKTPLGAKRPGGFFFYGHKKSAAPRPYAGIAALGTSCVKRRDDLMMSFPKRSFFRPGWRFAAPPG
jgi:hypothetical protein